MAGYVVGIAHSTGWSEQHILWELPLATGFQYQHAALCLNGAVTIPSDQSLENELAAVFNS